MEALSCTEVWKQMDEITRSGNAIYNFFRTMHMDNFLIETDLFPKNVLETYSLWNLEKNLSAEQKKHFSALRGGSQGDYREGMEEKIDNAVASIREFSTSKRALITIGNNAFSKHWCDEDAKCMREIHFRLAGQELHATAFFRAQATLIFPKNIHFIGSLMNEMASRIDTSVSVGQLTYLASVLVHDRG